ncbi:hypothetical protein [Chroococcus sp. FPU101]|uniref:hypothetical protein n=1 Tax=Chroococcus sp. FPU101 TaxID=1974212 RepID=UPI001A8E1A2F|nr:hypothetical protein [Chroococcus sp. FPU101]GFE72048.1 hypothetical protein CFPU101_46580 [Chroococcus sp. FPU101]
MIDVLMAQLNFEIAQAVHLNQKVIIACQNRNWEQVEVLLEKAIATSKNCQKLLKQLIQFNLQAAQRDKS